MAKYKDDELDDVEDVPSDDTSDTVMPESDDAGQEIDDSEDIANNETGNDNQKEINDTSDDLLRQLKIKPTAAPAPEETDEDGLAPSKNPQLDKFQQYMSDYKKLQDQRRKGDLVNGLIAAGGKIGQSMAGKYSGNFNPDQTGNQMLAKMNERPVQDFEQNQIVQSRGVGLQDQMNSHDPTSPQSTMIRKYLNQRIPNLNLADDVSAADAMLLMKTIGKPTSAKSSQLPMVNQKTGQKAMGIFDQASGTFHDTQGNVLDGNDWVRDYKAQSFVDPKTLERLGFNAGTGKISGALTGPGVNAPVVPQNSGDLTSNKPIDINRSFLNSQQAKQVDHARDKFIQEVRDDRNSLNANDRVIQVLQAGGELGDLPREIQDQLNRAFGQKGHISDAQLGGLLGKPDWKNRVENAVSLGMNGKLTDENRQFLLDVANLIKKQNESYIDKKSKIYTANLYNDLKASPNLQKYKFNQDSVKNLLGVESAVHPEDQTPKRQLKEKKSGKIVPIKADKYDAALKSGLFEEVP